MSSKSRPNSPGRGNDSPPHRDGMSSNVTDDPQYERMQNDVIGANEQVRKMAVRERELIHELELLKTIYANDMMNAVNSVAINEYEINDKEATPASASVFAVLSQN